MFISETAVKPIQYTEWAADRLWLNLKQDE